jgi:hypothetical protein
VLVCDLVLGIWNFSFNLNVELRTSLALFLNFIYNM